MGCYGGPRQSGTVMWSEAISWHVAPGYETIEDFVIVVSAFESEQQLVEQKC